MLNVLFMLLLSNLPTVSYLHETNSLHFKGQKILSAYKYINYSCIYYFIK